MRVATAGLLVLLLQPDAAWAQGALLPAGAAEGPGVRVTAFVGYAPPATRTETRTIRDAALPGEISFGEFRMALGAGVAAGATVEYRLPSLFTVYGGGAAVRRGNSTETSDLSTTRRGQQGSSFVTARAGLALRLPESETRLQLRRLDASVFAGPTWTVELPRRDLIRVHAERMQLFGVLVGIDAQLPLGDGRFALNAAVEDNIVWWDHAELSARAASVHGSDTADSTVTAGATHLFLLRIGLVMRTR